MIGIRSEKPHRVVVRYACLGEIERASENKRKRERDNRIKNERSNAYDVVHVCLHTHAYVCIYENNKHIDTQI